ncbi:amidohydrolase family protein [Nonomuraea sp. B12E4]|uniref:amidohydrolase family protein n=1 Tax=Nonomuraea sp. B12E4 TaxID=3153564 RepID=UPI00325F7271
MSILPDVDDILDGHTHVDEVPALGWIDPPGKLVALLDEAGIRQAVVMTYTEYPGYNPQALDYLAQVVGRYPDRLIGFVRVHPWYQEEMPRIIDRALGELGMKGVKLHPVGTLDHPAGPSTLRVLELAAERNAPVLFHCGDEPMTTPLAIAEAARRVPEATVILGHMGGFFHVREAIEVAERLPNVVLETSAMPYPAAIREAVQRIGADRVIYGSDGPGCPPRLEIRKVIAAGLDTEAQRAVLGANMRRLLAAVRA